jgi:hypothetical protein
MILVPPTNGNEELDPTNLNQQTNISGDAGTIPIPIGRDFITIFHIFGVIINNKIYHKKIEFQNNQINIKKKRFSNT